jgi:hypothetical protein
VLTKVIEFFGGPGNLILATVVPIALWYLLPWIDIQRARLWAPFRRRKVGRLVARYNMSSLRSHQETVVWILWNGFTGLVAFICVIFGVALLIAQDYTSRFYKHDLLSFGSEFLSHAFPILISVLVFGAQFLWFRCFRELDYAWDHSVDPHGFRERTRLYLLRLDPDFDEKRLKPVTDAGNLGSLLSTKL